MQVLSLGLPRTGTASMARALTILGFGHVAHGFDLLDSEDYVRRWDRAVDAKTRPDAEPFTRADWDELLGSCGAVTDMPCAFFWRELCSAYPDGKVVLVQRDEDKWANSFQDAVVTNMFSPSGKFARLVLEPILGSPLGAFTMKVLIAFLGADTEVGMRNSMREKYREHYALIRAELPKERVLDYELGTGWEPLCDFLGKPIPREEFPRINEADALQAKVEEVKKVYARRMNALLLWRVVPVLVGGAGLVLWLWS
jgi:hypothetical protein